MTRKHKSLTIGHANTHCVDFQQIEPCTQYADAAANDRFAAFA